MDVMPGRKPRFTEPELRAAIAKSKSWTQVLREIGYCPSGGNPATAKKYAARWAISVEHFDPYAGVMDRVRRPTKPLSEILVEHSTFSRSNLKQRLYKEGLKEPVCELCGQGEVWRGRYMSLILDHINGIRDDNRIANLRIVCPNCAATFDTHCGRSISTPPPLRHCERCGAMFRAKHSNQRYCSRTCGTRWDRSAARGIPKPETRKVERPPYEELMEELGATSYVAVGRKYGVSDNAVRKWVRFYERERERTSERR
jgi:ribosomal protein S27AE